MATNVIFFGSTGDSVIVLEKLFSFGAQHPAFNICCIVTQPAKPVGRTQTITPTPVELWAKAHETPVLAFPNLPDRPSFYEDERVVIDTLAPFQPDLIVSASYGTKIPIEVLKGAKFGGLNVHPSLLPRWRGADPVPWAMMSGDHQVGVTINSIAPEFDEGKVIAQKKIPLTDKDFSDPLRTRLFEMGALLLTEILPDYLVGELDGHAQDPKKATYARKLTREDGFEPWETIEQAMTDGTDADRIERKARALTPWPGIWTLLRQCYGGQATTEKRLKILDLTLDNKKLVINTVQLEGKKPVSYAQFSSAYLSPVSS